MKRFQLTPASFSMSERHVQSRKFENRRAKGTGVVAGKDNVEERF